MTKRQSAGSNRSGKQHAGIGVVLLTLFGATLFLLDQQAQQATAINHTTTTIGEMTMEKAKNLSAAHLRVARPTDDLPAVLRFYREGLGFEVLYEFKDHDGFDGVMLGHPGAAYHLEFTRKAGHKVGRAPTEDNLLVFYLPDIEQWKQVVNRLQDKGYRSVESFNPYWDKQGKTFADPDGYRVVLQNASWPAV